MAELDKFKRRLIRSVARLRHKEKLPADEMWNILNKETGRDTKAIWKRMSVLCLKKLSRLLAVDDYVSAVPQLARMSLTDWIMFDLVLVHEEPDVCRRPQESSVPEANLTAFHDLLKLVKHYELDRQHEGSLPEVWAELTLKYNEIGREASPMLLQLRWHQMKTSARTAFYKFWQQFRGSSRNLQQASGSMPSPLHLAVVKMFPKIITSQMDTWTELIQKKKVVLFDQFVVAKGSDNSAIKKVYEQGCFLPPDNIDGETTATDTNEPDIVLLEPKIDTITLEDDSDSETTEKTTTTKTDSSTVLQNTNVRDDENKIKTKEISNSYVGMTIKQEPEEEMEVDGLMNVKILEASHVPTEELDETDEQTQEPEIDKETENATSILGDLLNLDKSVDNTEQQIIEEKSPDDCIMSGENDEREEETNLDEDINDITEIVEDISEVVENITTTEALQSHDMPSEDNLNDCVMSGEEKENKDECPKVNNDEDRNIIPTKTIEECSQAIDKISSTEALQSIDMQSEDSPHDSIMSREDNNKDNEHEKEIHLDKDRNDIIKKTIEISPVEINKTTTTEVLQRHDMTSKDVEKPTEEEKQKDLELNPLTELPSTIELLDDGIDLCEEDDDDLFYQDNTVMNDCEIKPEPTEKPDSEDDSEDSKIDEDSEPAKLDLKLIMYPVVYTTKLEDMTLFQEADYENIKTDVLIDAITAESKPVSIKSINIKPAVTMTKETKVIALNNEEKRCSEDLIKLVPDVHDDEVHDDQVHDDQVHDDEVHDDEVHSDEEDDTDEIPERVNITSSLFKKPTFRNYNSISVCKNPDFNTRLKRLSVGFFTLERNRQLYNACKPLTVDLHKSFEMKLDNGIIYFNKESSNSPKTVSETMNYQPVSITPSALPAQCLIDNTKSDIQELLIPAKNTDAVLTNEQPKGMNLPHIDKVRRINQQLLTVEVSPMIERYHDKAIEQNKEILMKSLNSNSIHADQVIKTNVTEDKKIDMTSTQEAELKPVEEVMEPTKPLLSLEISPLYLNIAPTTISGDKPNSANTIVSNVPAKLKKPKKTTLSTNVNGTVPWYLRKLNNDVSKVVVKKSKEDEALITADSLYSMIEVMEGKWSEGKKKKFTQNFNEQSSKEADINTENAPTPNPTPKIRGRPKKPTKKKEYCCWALEKYCCDRILSGKQPYYRQNTKVKKTHDCGSVCSCCCRHILAKSFESCENDLVSDNPEKSHYSSDAIEKAVNLITDTNEEIDLPTETTTPAVSVHRVHTNSKVAATDTNEEIDLPIDTTTPAVTGHKVYTNSKVAAPKNTETTSLHNIKDIDNCFGNLVNLIESKTQIDATTESETEKALPKLNSAISNELIILSDEEDDEKIITANHLVPKWTLSPLIQNNKNKTMSTSSSTFPETNLVGSKYTIKYKQSLTPECPIKIGKNQILLTTVKIPPHLLSKELTYLPEPVVSAPVLDQSKLLIPDSPLPKGVSLVLQPNGQLNAALEDGVVLQYDDLKQVENIVSNVQLQINLHFRVGTESDAAKCDVDVASTNVTDLSNSATDVITDIDTNVETTVEVPTVITNASSTDLSAPIANDCESSDTVSNPIFQANHGSNNDTYLGENQQKNPLCQNDQDPPCYTNAAPKNLKKGLTQSDEEKSESHDINKCEDAAENLESLSKSNLNYVTSLDNSASNVSDVNENSRDGKKSILSDLMEMSGISSEDVQPSTTEVQPSTTEVQLPYLYPALDCTTDAADQQPCNALTQVTTVECLKYAFNQNGKFFKMDINTGSIKRIEVLIEKRKQITKQTKRIYIPQSPPVRASNPRTLVIDLTNQDHLSQATKPMISLKPLKKYNSKSKVSNDVQTGLLSEISQLKTKQISLLRKHIHLRNFMQLSKSNKEEIKNKLQNTINLVDADEPMLEEYLIESEEDDISDVTLQNINKRPYQEVCSDDSDDEPLAKKVQRKKDEETNIEGEISDVNVPVDYIEQNEEYEIEQLEDDNDVLSDASHDSGECILGA